MCGAIPLAILLVTAFAGLTVLRWLRSPTPNADLMIVLLSRLEGPDDIPQTIYQD